MVLSKELGSTAGSRNQPATWRPTHNEVLLLVSGAHGVGSYMLEASVRPTHLCLYHYHTTTTPTSVVCVVTGGLQPLSSTVVCLVTRDRNLCHRRSTVLCGEDASSESTPLEACIVSLTQQFPSTNSSTSLCVRRQVAGWLREPAVLQAP